MKEKNLGILLLYGFVFAVLVSAFWWGATSVGTGTINGAYWGLGDRFVYGCISLIGLVIGIGGAAWLYDSQKK
jgi:hypothetical protein